jgi:hypothetical protein
MPTRLARALTVALLAVAPQACGGPGGGHPTAGGSTPALFQGSYHFVSFAGASSPSETVTSWWGTVTAS